MKEIRNGFYKRFLSPNRYLTVEVVGKETDDQGAWIQDERITAIHQYKREAGKIFFRIGDNLPMEAVLYQVRFDEFPEDDYEYFTAGMSDIHPNDRIEN